MAARRAVRRSISSPICRPVIPGTSAFAARLAASSAALIGLMRRALDEARVCEQAVAVDVPAGARVRGFELPALAGAGNRHARTTGDSRRLGCRERVGNVGIAALVRGFPEFVQMFLSAHGYDLQWFGCFLSERSVTVIAMLQRNIKRTLYLRLFGRASVMLGIQFLLPNFRRVGVPVFRPMRTGRRRRPKKPNGFFYLSSTSLAMAMSVANSARTSR